MGHIRRTPIHDGDVQAGDLGEPHGTFLAVRREVRLSPVIAVADTVDSDFVTIDFGPGRFCDVGRPGAVIARLQREPPQEDKGEGSEDSRQFQQFSANKNHGDEQNEHEDASRHLPNCGKIVIDRAKCPCRTKDRDDPGQQPSEQSKHFHRRNDSTRKRQSHDAQKRRVGGELAQGNDQRVKETERPSDKLRSQSLGCPCLPIRARPSHRRSISASHRD